MAQKNRHRSERRRNVRLLEKALSLRDRLFSLMALRRGLRRLRYGLVVLVLLAIVGAGIYYSTIYAVDKTYSLSIDNITYDSRQRLISKEQALDILGIKGAVNLATLNAAGMEAKLEENLCIASAHIRIALPDTLHIEVDERIPIAYVEMESAAGTGQRTRLFMCPEGVLFPVVPEFHRNFLNAPTWYLHSTDVEVLEPGEVIAENKRRPILELVAASNHYDPAEIPRIREIFRPKDWKIIITLEDGTEVLMQVYDLREQMDRLAMILEHARTTHRHAASINVIPRLNPTVIYREEGKESEKAEDEGETTAGKDRESSSRRNRGRRRR